MNTPLSKNNRIQALAAWMDLKETHVAHFGNTTHEALELALLCASHHMDQQFQRQSLSHLLCHAPVDTPDGLAAAIVAAMTANNLAACTVERWGPQVRELFGDTVADSWATLASKGFVEDAKKFHARLLAREGRPGKIVRAVFVGQLLQGYARVSAQILFSADRPLHLRALLDADHAFLESLPEADHAEPDDTWIANLQFNARLARKALSDRLDELAAPANRAAA